MTEQSQPSTPAEAIAQLSQRLADPEWGARFTAGDVAAKREYSELQTLAMKDGGDAAVDVAMAGGKSGAMQSSHDVLIRQGAEFLRGSGLPDEIVRQALTGAGVSKAEFDAVVRWKSERMADHEWVKRYLDGDGEPNRQMTAANIVITNGIREEKAA